MSAEITQLEQGIAALEAQRTLLGDTVVEAMLAPARARLATLRDALGAAERQQLRQVSILFMDVVGSTTLSQRLDPEAVSAVMDDALARGTALVQAQRGRVLQYAGDNILAAFGADEAREDDAEHAVRCGLALLELGQVLGREVLARHGHAGFDVRVGIHTGAVLLGGGVDAEGSIRGSAVNIAARMEQTAPGGALRISHDTYALVRGLFEVEAQAPLPVKGVDEPVQSYLVVAAKPRNFRIGTRGIEGVATRMVGRDAELEELQQAFRRLYEPGRFSAITVVADAGLGKSRLLYEFEAWSETRPESFYVFRGRATPQTESQPYGLLRDILAWRFQIGDEDSIEAARAKLEQGLVPLFLADDGPEGAEAHAHLLGHLVGIEWRDSRHLKGILEDPRQIRNRAFHAAAQMFRRISASAGLPIVLQLEDLHWADAESLDFLAYLAEVNRDLPLLLLAFARPVLFERRASWGAGDLHRRIELAPLDVRASRELAHELLKKLPEVPAALRELLTGGAEGNPFYMEELVKMLIDQRAIETGEAWRVNADRLLLTHVPGTLTGVLQARLDSLPADEKRSLQEASVIGAVFWDRALLALEPRAADTLPRLVQRELAVPRPDAAQGDDGLREYAFKHQILHQVTYATVLRARRRELHGKLAHWLAAHTGLRANDFLGLAAEHFEQAGEDVQAAEFHARAAAQAGSRLAHAVALQHAQRALALAGPGDDALRWRVLRVREATLDIMADRAAQRADIEAMEALAERLDDTARRAHAAWRRSYLGQRIGDWPMMAVAARQACAWAEAAGDAPLRVLAQRNLAVATLKTGDPEAGQRLAEQTLAEARALGLPLAQSQCLNALSVILEHRGAAMVDLIALQRQALQVNLTLGDRRGEAVARCNIGDLALALGQLDEARRELEAGLRLSRANGERAQDIDPLRNLSVLASLQGDDARALALAREALDLAIATQARWPALGAGVVLGNAELALGRHAEAGQAYADSHRWSVELDDPIQHDASAGLARVALARGDLAAALLAVQPLVALAARDGADPRTLLYGAMQPRRIEWTVHRVLARTGEPGADAWLRLAHEQLQAAVRAIGDPGVAAGFIDHWPEHREIPGGLGDGGGIGVRP